MHTVSTFRLYLLRAAYLLIFVGLVLMIWTRLLAPPPDLEHMRGVVWSLLAAVSLLALVGVRYPLRMLPVLFFELVWKVIWLALIGVPAWQAGSLTPEARETLSECLVGVAVAAAVIPWGYVYHAWVKAPWERRGEAVPA